MQTTRKCFLLVCMLGMSAVSAQAVHPPKPVTATTLDAMTGADWLECAAVYLYTADQMQAGGDSETANAMLEFSAAARMQVADGASLTAPTSEEIKSILQAHRTLANNDWDAYAGGFVNPCMHVAQQLAASLEAADEQP